MTLRNYSSTAAATTITASVTNADTSCVVAATTGFPAAPFIGRLDADTASEELVLVTAAAGTTLTITRGYDGTTAVSHNNGASFRHSVAAIDLREPNTHANSTGAVHGLTGNIVGTTDTQTLTNKTFTSPTITTPTLSGSGGALTLPAGPDTLVGRGTTDTLTNKTLTSPTLSGATLSGTTTNTGATISGGTVNPASIAVNGTSDLAAGWTTFVPTLTQSVTVTKTVSYAKYIQVGKTMIGMVNETVTGSGTSGEVIAVGLPVAAAAGTAGCVGSYFYNANGAVYSGSLFLASSTTAQLGAANGGTWLGASPVIAAVSSHVISYVFTYETA